MNIKWLNKVWPWSMIAASRAEVDKWHAMAKAQNDHSAFVEQMAHFNGFYTFMHRALGAEKMMALAAEYNAETTPSYGFVGALGRPDKAGAKFPPKGTGEIDPKIVGPVAQAFVKAAQERQENGK